ncbi:hypothetical protein [Pelomonas sp. SE-A7]|uniref:hypothetical protein n=1 Tax=Pelomonas sp. SE-A7 TaxID=3054953 RepID=UPI00259C9E55|nr:hypothetical protein [Pelomonas sp. SE-A7]MDM4764959.1 hypothetical protein [Pelomonas sp. SE-A7]
MLNTLFSRWNRSPELAAPSTQSRSSTSSVDTLFQSLLRLIPGEADPWRNQPKPSHRETLSRARGEFLQGLQDVQGEMLPPLLTAIRSSRSLRDLWHLRPAVYTEVARCHSQYEAERRLAKLDSFFDPGAGRRGH